MLDAILELTAKGITPSFTRHPNGNLIVEVATFAYGEIHKHVCHVPSEMINNTQGRTSEQTMGEVLKQCTAALEAFIREKYLSKLN